MRPEILFPLFKTSDTLKGVGPRIFGLLTKLTGPNVIDLFYHLPVGFVERHEISTLSDQYLTKHIIVSAEVVKHFPSRSRKIPYRVLLDVNGEKLTLTFFNGREDYLKRQLPINQIRKIYGKLERYSQDYQITHPDHILEPDSADIVDRFEPVYPLTAGLTNNSLLKIQSGALKNLIPLSEWIDPHLLAREKWISWKDAMAAAHAPKSEEELLPESPVRQRLAYDEILSNQIALELVRNSMKRKKGRALAGNKQLDERTEAALPFKLTGAQQSALMEILGDMAAPYRMLRLLQGDVGSGKTVVALVALMRCIGSGAQGAFMAPTEILARQHLQSLQPITDALGVKIELLTGRMKGKKRDELLARLASGEIDILVGTHALFQEDVVYSDLGLAIIDEQHRFGVHQRLSLSAKGRPENNGVDVLVMTATPIPRTLALAAYGDMDVSIIAEKPPGRQPIDTVAIEIDRLDDLANSLARKLEIQERIYWVCPLVEESEVSDLAAAEDRYRYLEALYPGKVGLVHGRMKSDEKDAAMQAFKEGQTQILVATTVIEVGVDVPEATVMIIEHAERFGLAQLHQLRGRVGRGGLAGSCLLLYAGPLGETQKSRLKIMRETEDGFKIAEEDLRLRGAGELLGTKQSGLPQFKVADLQAHARLVQIARDDARAFLNIDPTLSTERGQAIRTLLYLFERDSAIKYLQSG